MAYNGILFSVGDYNVTGENYINIESYKVTKCVQDLDSYRDANGELHRNALEHVSYKIEMTTREGLTEQEMADFLGGMQSNFKIPLERKASVTAFVPELDDYITQDMYMPDPNISIKSIIKGKMKYKGTEIKFIGY